MRYLVKRIPNTSLVHYDGSKYYCEIAGGADEKASVNTSELLAGSKYLDCASGTWYVYDELTDGWAVSKEGGSADPEVIADAVSDWLDDHPEATTTVQDGSVTYAKLDATMKGKVDEISSLSDEIGDHAAFIDGISQSTKNLINPIRLMAVRPALRYNNNVWSGVGSDWNPENAEPFVVINDTSVIRYTLSFEAKVEGPITTGGGLFFKFTDADGYNQIGVPNNTSDWTEFSLTSRAYHAVQNLTTLWSSGAVNAVYVRNLQLEVGTEKTSYVFPLTAYDEKASARLDTLDSYGINTYPEIKPMAYKAYVNFASIPFTTGKRLKTNGVIETNASYAISDYIFVLAGESVDYNLYSSNASVSNVGKFNLDKTVFTNLVSTVSGGSSTHIGTYTATEDCYIVFCGDKSYTYTANYSGVKETVTDRLDTIQNVLPEYWETYLSGKNNSINELIATVGNHGDYFMLFTDYHYARNTGYTPAIIRRLYKAYPFDLVFYLGDTINTENTIAETETALDAFNSNFKGINMLSAFGNHDNNPYKDGQTLTESQVYNFIFKQNEQRYRIAQEKGGYYYYDNPVQKIRYIVLNTGANGFTDTDKAVQLPWLINTLNSVESGWYVAIIMHICFEWYKDDQDQWYIAKQQAGNVVKSIADAYQNRTTGTVLTTVAFDFTNANGNMACVLSGHTHAEFSEVSSAGYPIIGFDRDAINYGGQIADQRQAGTVTEQALYIVSIDTTAKTVKTLGLGAGTDRNFTFT